MWKKIENYYWTLKYLRKSQLIYLVKNRLERGKRAVPVLPAKETAVLPLWMEDLDACPEYLRRFDVKELQKGHVTLLYESGKPEGRNWEHPDRSHLWNFNLHYLEFLIPLAASYRREKDIRYYECFRRYCRRWIRDNQEGTGDGWHPYTISLRLTNLWICMDGFGDAVREDRAFLSMLNDSMYAQYRFLQKRLERHLLGNHYFENLKAVFLGSLYFQEPSVCKVYKKRLQKEIQEQILSDGVHYERSLMYHKIILEDVMRAAKAVQEKDASFYQELMDIVKKMTDAAWNLEKGLGCTPLFNDAGDNVARPLLQGLLKAAKSEFGICPDWTGKMKFSQAGYYCIENDKKQIKVILDAGEMAPAHMPGHGHCDGLGFELGYRGKPLFVNSGTGQYQGELRSYFRSTAAHNTVVINGEEQSVCWGEHRVGRRMTAAYGTCGEDWAEGSLITCRGERQSRKIQLREDTVEIWDRVRGHASLYLHLAPGYEYQYQERYVQVLGQEGNEICRIYPMQNDRVQIHRDGDICSYAPEFGRLEQIQVLEVAWDSEGSEHELRIEINA